MKATILQSHFAKGLAQVSRIVSTRTTLPVLGNILVSAKKGRITFSSTDLEVGITTQVTGKVEEEGDITIPARLLSDFILNNSDETIVVTTAESKANLKSNHYEATIAGISSEEFPTIPELPAETFVTLKREDFLDAIKKTLIAPSHDETRPTISGIYFQFSAKELVLVATDSYRLAEKKMPLTAPATEKKMIIPTRTMTEVMRLLSTDKVEDIKLLATENQVFFVIGDTYLVSRIIEGAFPNYSQIVPAGFKVLAEVAYSDLLSAMKMVSLFAKDAANNIKVKIGSDEVTVASALAQTGNAQSKLAAKATGGEIEISFNARYVLDALNVVSAKNVSLKLNDSASAGVLEFDSDKDFLYIIMPLKLES